MGNTNTNGSKVVNFLKSLLIYEGLSSREASGWSSFGACCECWCRWAAIGTQYRDLWRFWPSLLQRGLADSTSRPCLGGSFDVSAIPTSWSCLAPLGSSVRLMEKHTSDPSCSQCNYSDRVRKIRINQTRIYQNYILNAEE